MALAKNLKKLRKDAGLSRAALAAFAGLHRDNVRRLEEGLTKHPRSDTLEALAKHLDTTVGELLA